MDFDTAVKSYCEHGINKVIVCPKCHPELYVDTPEIIARAKKLQEEFYKNHPELADLTQILQYVTIVTSK